MAITARNNKNIAVVTKLTNTGKLQTGTPVTLRNTVQNQISMGELVDVLEGTPADGSAIIYNSQIDKYEVKPISAQSIGSVDGGEF